MTNEELFDDLKQYIGTRMSQQSAELATKADIKDLKADVASLKADVSRLDEKIDAVQDAIAETVTHVADSAETAVREHEERCHGRLKHRAA
jgi:N-methylhydantoinase B/oxoprolinase/acetone carboxylase alpha subunit